MDKLYKSVQFLFTFHILSLVQWQFTRHMEYQINEILLVFDKFQFLPFLTHDASHVTLYGNMVLSQHFDNLISTLLTSVLSFSTEFELELVATIFVGVLLLVSAFIAIFVHYRFRKSQGQTEREGRREGHGCFQENSRVQPPLPLQRTQSHHVVLTVW